MNAATLYADACTYRVDAVVEALYCYLGALAGDACDAADGDCLLYTSDAADE